MSFYSRYQLERLLADGPAKTFRAVENSSGRPVFLHLFDPEGRLLFDTIAARFRDSAGRLTPPLIETGEFAGALYAVTEIIDPFVNLTAWAESVASGLVAAPAPKPEPRPIAGSSTKEPGEFTRMFALQQGAPPAEIQPKPVVSPGSDKEPGAFTREFMVHAPTPPVVQPPRAGQSAWPQAPPQTPPILKPEPPKAPEIPMWPESQPGRSNDISDLFGAALPGEHVDVEAEQARAAGLATPDKKPFRRAGTFTRMFGPGAPRKTVSSPERAPKTISSFFDSGLDLGKPKAAPPDSKIEAREKTGPGEYTRMMAIPQQNEEPVQPLPPPAQMAVPSAEPRANRALVVAFVLVGVLFIAVIILVALLYSRR
ncbi:MAG TPA: hypothetical protein VK752_30055 [Bryobacteraceae bacterium]|nr:hypothetical protein [Bryobacteraceae bacterium]